MPTGAGFGFGPFRLDVRSRRLFRDNALVPLRRRHFDLLHHLLTHTGRIVTKDALITAAWRDVVVEENTLTQAIAQLRTALEAGDPKRYIETVSGHGYRFVEDVTLLAPRETADVLDAMLAPHRALIDGRAALETLERARVAEARATFARALATHENDATLHVGMANACVLEFEATRVDKTPDVAALQLAVTHAREACALSPDFAEGWATFGFVLDRVGERTNALAALRRSVTIEPNNWRHWLRLAYAGWGEERLRAAERTLVLLPHCPMAHWLVATVHVARHSLAAAELDVDAGINATQDESPGATRFPVVALFWLKGLLCLARGADDEALGWFDRELSLEQRGHLYTRECCANVWYAIGAVHLRRAQTKEARAAFDQTLRRVSQHAMAHAGLRLLLSRARGASSVGTNERPTNTDTPHSAALGVDDAIADAAVMVAAGGAAAAAQHVCRALGAAPAGSAGWRVAIEPLLDTGRTPEAWAPVFALLRTRAS